MKVIFVSSGSYKGKISPIVFHQGNSLKKAGINVIYFSVSGNGIFNYVKAIFSLRKLLKQIRPDIVHAHYGLCGIVAKYACKKEIIVTSFMGSDLIGQKSLKGLRRIANNIILKFHKRYARQRYDFNIVKSEEMLYALGEISNTVVIPNGVDLEIYRPADEEEAMSIKENTEKLNQVIFVSNPSRPEKNFRLAKKAVALLKNSGVTLKVLNNLSAYELRAEYISCGCLLMTSLHEGSPNVVKEAMACNCPVVTTNVGDVSLITENTEGYFITSYSPEDVADKIRNAIYYKKSNFHTQGRKRILELKLDSESVAKNILRVYTFVLNKKKNNGI